MVRRIAERIVPDGEKQAAEMTLEDMRMTMVERVSEWPEQWVRESPEQGQREGIEQGTGQERALLARMAASRFGTNTSERLSSVLAAITDPERLAEVGDVVSGVGRTLPRGCCSISCVLVPRTLQRQNRLMYGRSMRNALTRRALTRGLCPGILPSCVSAKI